MRTAVLAIAAAAGLAACAADEAEAMDLPVPGLALNTDVVLEHKFDAEATALTIEPELEFTPQDGPLTLTLGTELSVWDNTNEFTLDDEFDVLPTIDFGATFEVPAVTNMELELGTSYDFETETRGEITATATFSF